MHLHINALDLGPHQLGHDSRVILHIAVVIVWCHRLYIAYIVLTLADLFVLVSSYGYSPPAFSVHLSCLCEMQLLIF